MCFVPLTYLCLCWSEFFDNIAFHTVRVLHMRSYVVSLSAEWLSELADQKGLHVTGLCNQWQPRGSLGSGQLIRVPAENDGTEIMGSAGVKGWPEKSVHARCSLPQKQTHSSHSVSTLLKLSGLSLRGKREYLWQDMDLSSMSYMKAWPFANTGVSQLQPSHMVQGSKGQLLLEMV